MDAIPKSLRTAFGLVVQVFDEFGRDDCIPLAGSLAFFTLFSFAPLLALVIDIASVLVDPELIRGQIAYLLQEAFGPDVAGQARDLITTVRARQADDPVARLGSIGLLVFAATMVLAQAQVALNRVWGVERRAGLRSFLFKRFVSLGVILGLVILLLVSLVASALVSTIGPHLDLVMPQSLRGQLISVGNTSISFGMLALVAVLVHRVLPEARIPWSDAAIGGVVTALLLTAGHRVIGFILSTTSLASIFGAASSLALLLFWVFYSSAIVLWGAEFTKVIARRRGHVIRPRPGARRMLYRLAQVSMPSLVRRKRNDSSDGSQGEPSSAEGTHEPLD